MAVVRLGGVMEDHWRFLQTSRPELAARGNGIVTSLPDPALDRAKKDAQFARAALAALDEVLVDALTEDDYVTWLSLRWEMEAMAGWPAFHWTNAFHFSPGHSVLDRTIAILKSQPISDPGAAQWYVSLVSRVSDLARILGAEYAERARRDIRLSRPVAERAIAHIREFIAPPAISPFGLPQEFNAALDTAWQSQFARQVGDVIVQHVNPSLGSLAELLEGERDRAPDTLGLARFPGGAAHYATLLRYRTTLEITPEDAHTFGLREVARIASLAAAARREAALPVSRDSLRAALRGEPFALDERNSIPERVAQLYEAAVRDMDSLFRPVPSMALSIGMTTAPSSASPLATYDAPTFTRPSAGYLLNTEQLLRKSALTLPGLVAGDLMPGLHLQQGAQFENAGLPVIRRLWNHDGFVAGWQMYALEVTDSLSKTIAPWQRFGLRLRELSAACGLVVDTGINALGWTRADALNFLRAYLPDDDADLDRDFIMQAAESPGRLSAATLGAREFRGLRRWAMHELGDRFSLAAFHREILRVGSVPLPVLGSHLERWIWEQNHPAPPPAAVHGQDARDAVFPFFFGLRLRLLP
jgi:uncharacterized protein (DUF885 family)